MGWYAYCGCTFARPNSVGSNPTRCQHFQLWVSENTPFPVKYKPYAFLLWADTRNVVASSPARTVWVQVPPGVNIFRCRYKNIHLFPVKYRTYTFLLWADTRNVVAPSPTRTVWVQIPPGANFFRCRYQKMHLFPAKYSHMSFATLLITEGCWEIRQTLFVRIVFFYWKTNWDCLVWGGVSLSGPDIGATCPAPKRLQRFWWNFDGIGSRAWSTLWDGWLPPENLVEKNIGKKLFPHVKPMGNLGYFQKWFSRNPL